MKKRKAAKTRTKVKSLNGGRYRLLLDLIDRIPDVIYFKDRQGRFVMVNKAHAKGLGLKPQQVVGKTDFDIFPKERAQAMAKDDEYVMKTGKSIIDKIERATRPDGVDNYVSTTKMPRYDSKGKIIGLMGITRDITRRMQLERLEKEKINIEKKIESLQEISNVKSDFVSIVSHELRTPLAIIKEAVMLILDKIAGPVTDKQRELLSKTEENIERLKKIIDDLLDISRLEGKRLVLHYSLVNINDLLKDTSEFFTKLAAQKGIKLEYKLPEKEVNIFIDSERIRQIAANLINNAIKFTEEGGKISVEVDILETMARVKVSDTGVGIPYSDMPKLFNKFVQVSKDASAKKKGVGLGLAISKELVELHGGRMWVKSQPGVGSQFCFTLPLLYTRHILPVQMRDVVNSLLSKDTALSLIELFIVNYEKFRDKYNVNSQSLIEDMNNILNNLCKQFSQLYNLTPQIFSHDSQSGEFSIVFSESKEDKTNDICNSISAEVKDYFEKNKIGNAFIKVDIVSWPFEKQILGDKNRLGNVNMKRVLVGLEVRRFERIPYKLKAQIGLVDKKKEIVNTLDISEGGFCFEGRSYLEKDAQVDVDLSIPRQKTPVYTKARVAWVKNIEGLTSNNISQYRAGLEFLGLTEQKKKIISSFVNSLSSAGKG